MSLSKSYQVACEGNLLMIRRDMAAGTSVQATREERAAVRLDCLYYSAREYSGKSARNQAKRDGWLRYAETFHGIKIQFDVCPACAPKVIPDHLPKGWAPSCQYCKEPMIWDAGPGVWRTATPDGTAMTDQCGKSYDNYHRPARPER